MTEHEFKQVQKPDGLWCEIYDKSTGKMVETYRYLTPDEHKEEMAKIYLDGKLSEGICPNCNKNYLRQWHDGIFMCCFCEKPCDKDKSLKACEKCRKTGIIGNGNKCIGCRHVQGDLLPPRCKNCDSLFETLHHPAAIWRGINYAPECTMYETWYCEKCKCCFFKDTLSLVNSSDLFDYRIILDKDGKRMEKWRIEAHLLRQDEYIRGRERKFR